MTPIFSHPSLDLFHCDCMDYMRTLPDKAFDLAIVDPPYGIGVNSSGRVGHYGGGGKKWDLAPPAREYFVELDRVSVCRVIWGGNYFSLGPTRCFLIWDKQQPEEVSFASCEYAWTNFDESAKTFYLRPQNADNIRIHPTQKPVALYKWLLQNYAQPGQRILDTHLGSGSHAIACHQAGYHLTACEKDGDYVTAAIERFKRETAQMDMFVAPPLAIHAQPLLLP